MGTIGFTMTDPLEEESVWTGSNTEKSDAPAARRKKEGKWDKGRRAGGGFYSRGKKKKKSREGIDDIISEMIDDWMK